MSTLEIIMAIIQFLAGVLMSLIGAIEIARFLWTIK